MPVLRRAAVAPGAASPGGRRREARRQPPYWLAFCLRIWSAFAAASSSACFGLFLPRMASFSAVVMVAFAALMPGRRRLVVRVGQLVEERLQVRVALHQRRVVADRVVGGQLAGVGPAGGVVVHPLDERRRRGRLVRVLALVGQEHPVRSSSTRRAFWVPICGTGAAVQSTFAERVVGGLPHAVPVEGGLAGDEGVEVAVLGDVRRAVALLDEVGHPGQRLHPGVGVEGRLGDVLVEQLAAASARAATRTRTSR